MRRVLRLVSLAAVVATAGLTAAQAPTTPSPVPAPSPAPTQPSGPIPPPSADPAPAESPAATDAAPTVPGGRSTWRSQDGSIVDITVDLTTGTLTGTFAPGFPCGSSTLQPPVPRPIVGTVSANAVAWTLSLPACPSVGTWVGHYQTVGTEDRLTMLFTLAVPEGSPGVGSTLIGSTLFVRQAAR
jgi:hypothetical protein